MPKPTDMTDEDFAGLTEEERASFEDDAPEADAAAPEAGQEQPDEAADGAAGGAAEPEAPKESAEAEPATEESAKAEISIPPSTRGEAPPDAVERLATLDAEKAALAGRVENGGLTLSAYVSEAARIDGQRDELRSALIRAEITRNQTLDAWDREVMEFLGEHPEIHAKPIRLQAFDAALRLITSDGQNANLSNRKVIQTAYDLWAEELGVTSFAAKPQPQPAPSPAAATSAPQPPKPVAEHKPAPPTLAKIPAADISETDDGKYAALDRLQERDPVAYEAAIAKMSDAEFAAYTRAA